MNDPLKWPDGTARLLKPGEYIGYDHKTIDGKGVLMPVIRYEKRRIKWKVIADVDDGLDYLRKERNKP